MSGVNDQAFIDANVIGYYVRGADGRRHLVPPHWNNTACGLAAGNLPPAQNEAMCAACVAQTGLPAAEFALVVELEAPDPE